LKLKKSHIKFFTVILAYIIVSSALSWTILTLARSSGPGKLDYLELYTQIYDLVQKTYLEKTDPEILALGSIEGMLLEVSPYCSLDPVGTDSTGYFKGGPVKAGVVLGYREPLHYIIDVVPGSSAEKAGLQPGDAIVRIRDQVTPYLTISRAYRLLSGEPGDKIEVLIQDRNTIQLHEKTIELTQLPDPVKIHTEFSDQFMVLKLTGDLNNNGVNEVHTLLTEHAPQKGLILDLRHLNCGDSSDGIKLADLFIADGIKTCALCTEGKGNPEKFYSQDRIAMTDFPMVTIISSNSAGPAETCALALRTTGRSVLVGEKTFGMALKYTQTTLDDAYSLSIVSAMYCDMQDKIINKNGVIPDRRVVLPIETDDDPFLLTATDILTCLKSGMGVSDFAT
jgi:carboxyl-terminal processing protease